MNDDTNNDQATERQVMEYIPDRKPRTFRVSAGIAAVIVAITLAVGMVVGLAIPAGAQADPEANQPGYWGKGCTKPIDGGYTGGASWTADADYSLVVLNSSTVNDTFTNVKKGTVLSTVSGKDISHIIVCPPVPPTTTTTQPEGTTTTTQGSTTTTVPESTTTTEPTTSTSHPTEATTTTVPESTTTQPEETTTTTVPVPPVTHDTPDELPFTGAETLYAALAGFAALVVGGGALVAVRRTE